MKNATSQKPVMQKIGLQNQCFFIKKAAQVHQVHQPIQVCATGASASIILLAPPAPPTTLGDCKSESQSRAGSARRHEHPRAVPHA